MPALDSTRIGSEQPEDDPSPRYPPADPAGIHGRHATWGPPGNAPAPRLTVGQASRKQ
ncbi:hypothetical protein A176_007702 [Myxococcus hansupus]|uniref:Uncharacterized protein n=1 Tax=Pseudomyxococcus hansupus TaxID=1297742 RepID=A0A0H4XAS6_9BACT|nr:hypothetical protein A176_007702 [Myxococcus hansupus]